MLPTASHRALIVDAAEVSFERGEFDGMEVRARGREDKEPRAAFLEDGLGLLACVAGSMIEDHDITRLQRGWPVGSPHRSRGSSAC